MASVENASSKAFDNPRELGLNDPDSKEIFVIQITMFEDHKVKRYTFAEYFISRAAAEEKVKFFQDLDVLGEKNSRYDIQTLCLSGHGSKIYVVSDNTVN